MLDTLELKISMDEFKKYLRINEDRRFGYSMKEDQKKHVTEELQLGIGDEITVYKANQIIPQLCS